MCPVRSHCQTAAICEAIGLAVSGFHYDPSWWSANGHAVATLVLLCIVLLGVGVLLLFHTFLMLTNVTSREFMRSEEVTYLHNTEDFDLPFSNGCLSNVRGFCYERSGISAAIKELRTGVPQEWTATVWARKKRIIRNSPDWKSNLWQNKYWSCC